MAEYVQLQTYATYDEDDFHEQLQSFREVLERLGCKDEQLITWLTQVALPESEEENFEGIYASPFVLTPAGAQPIECAGMAIALYTQLGAPSLEDPPSWVGFDLLFDVETVREPEKKLYKASVSGTIWRIASVLAETFREVGVYLTDEWQENLSWRVIVEGVGDPWLFDLALFPRELAARFEEVPAGFQGTAIEGAFGFAQANRWQTLPWLESTT